MTLRSRLELASAAFNATKPPRRGKRIRELEAIDRITELEAQNKQLLEVLKYVRAVLPSDRWADDTKKMIDAAIAVVEKQT